MNVEEMSLAEAESWAVVSTRLRLLLTAVDDPDPEPDPAVVVGQAADVGATVPVLRRRRSGSEAQRVGLVGCVKTKRPGPSAARDLYCSPLFRGRRAWVESTCARWMILSARYGLVDPDDVIDPYDLSLTTASAAQKRLWAQNVLADLAETVGDLAGVVWEVHAGADYRVFGLVDGLVAAGGRVEVPAAGLSQGEQLAFYRARRSSCVAGDGVGKPLGPRRPLTGMETD
jgi:hypothetical protein